jgi:hypothetical protein
MSFIDQSHIHGDITVLGIDSGCFIFTMFSEVSDLKGCVLSYFYVYEA